mgnify:CR=1 FL=1
MPLTLHPYYLPERRCWVFDDPATNLKAEEFVLGISEMIDRVVDSKRLPEPRRGFALTFSAEPFPGHDVELHLQHLEDRTGNWYAGDVGGERMEGWLCPALYKYFDAAPPRLFVRCDPLPAGVNPIWDNRAGEGMRFVGPGALDLPR